ncbi:hypothetical protein JXB41_05795 [Candidatus Woesearchaeota archaeon]|nr:hypothetical protein [Candidatus Woesearchaeota archaeon]
MQFINLLKNKNKITVFLILLVSILLIPVLIRAYSRLLFFIFAVIISATMTFFLNRFKSPVDFSPVFFFMIFISTEFGFGCSIIFYLLASLTPSLIAGGKVEMPTFMFMSVFFMLSFLAGLLKSFGIINVGIAAVIINVIAGWFINRLSGSPGKFIFSVIHALVTVVYIVNLSGFLENIIS